MKSEAEQFEKIPVTFHETSAEACQILAVEVGSLIRQRQAAGKHAVLGLATGSTPVPFYRELIKMHREEGLSFDNVITFNLDEYYGLDQQHRESYFRFMQEQLFEHIDIPEANINIPPGTVSRKEVYQACLDYERKIDAHGGIDIQILGIGRTGHIGFNEPGSTQESPTRMITLDKITREDAARDFLGIKNVPRFAITMGVGTILRAKRIVLMAWGENKAQIVRKAVEEPTTDAISASYLQSHPNAQFLLDRGATSGLTRECQPWLVGSNEWTDSLTRRAVTWLAGKQNKPILKLVDDDYNEHGMADLLTDQGPSYELNIRIFNELQHTISGWPGGKPDAEDGGRPEHAKPYPKHSLVLCPEPGDELLAMGGTINRLIEQGHRVDIGFLTSGNLGVDDESVERFAEVISDLVSAEAVSATAWEETTRFAEQLLLELKEKGPFGDDTETLRTLKSMVRRSEARHALRTCGVANDQVHFLDLPFYENSRYRRFHPSSDDADQLCQLMTKVKPHQIYMTGSASDPSSVSGVCYRLFRDALRASAKYEWPEQCRIWIYRSQEKPLESHEISMAVPMSPDQVKAKIHALAHYNNELTETGVESDFAIARVYDDLGLAEYEAIETFEAFGDFRT